MTFLNEFMSIPWKNKCARHVLTRPRLQCVSLKRLTNHCVWIPFRRIGLYTDYPKIVFLHEFLRYHNNSWCVGIVLEAENTICSSRTYDWFTNTMKSEYSLKNEVHSERMGVIKLPNERRSSKQGGNRWGMRRTVEDYHSPICGCQCKNVTVW